MLGLKGKTAVVFGVASEDSIAWAICQQLAEAGADLFLCLLYTSPSPRDGLLSRMPSSA